MDDISAPVTYHSSITDHHSHSAPPPARGASGNPKNRFEKLEYVPEPEDVPNEDGEAREDCEKGLKSTGRQGAMQANSRGAAKHCNAPRTA